MNKRKGSILLATMLAGSCLFGGCGKAEPSEKYQYGFDQLAGPFWRTDTIYNESVLLTQQENGEICGNLAFTPEKIISIRDYTLENEFVRGEDWEYRDGALYALPGSEMPFFTQAQMAGEGVADNSAIKDCREEAEEPYSILFTSAMTLFLHQVFVTYEYVPEEMADFPVQEYAGDKLPALQESIEGGYDLTILVLGDSISGGGQSSSGANLEPYCPNWVDIYGTAVQNEINRRNGTNCIVTVYNKSVGGMSSAHDIDLAYSPDGKSTWAEYYTRMYNPDLVIIAHGMNDGTWYVPEEEFKENLSTIMRQCQSQSSKELDFIIVGCMRPNDNGAGWRGSAGRDGKFPEGYLGTPWFNLQSTYLDCMKELEEENSHVVYVEMWEKHTRLLQNKKYEDMTVNNLNHPNDFIIRLYAMSMIDVTLPR